MNSVTFDHIDPSIFTVLTAPTLEPGVASGFCISAFVLASLWSFCDRFFGLMINFFKIIIILVFSKSGFSQIGAR